MKNIFKLSFLIVFLFIFNGCGEKEYEDKDLSKFFIEHNKEKLSKIYSIKTFVQYGVLDKRGVLVTHVNLSLISAPYFDYGFDECRYVMYIDSEHVTFTKNDIGNYGKEAMYKEAEKCLNTVIKEIEITENEKKKNEIEKQIQLKNQNDKLNKKFNENDVK